jgi:uncharacterized membrane protein YedE/YeeE
MLRAAGYDRWVIESLLDRPPWFVIGVLLGSVVVGYLWVANERLGALGGYSALLERATRRAPSLGGKAWFLLGIVAGAIVFYVLSGGAAIEGYGWLTRTFTGDAAVFVPILLLSGGVLIGYGAKLAGGCTSGNGICGTSLGAASSFVATATFMASAVLVAHVIAALI